MINFSELVSAPMITSVVYFLVELVKVMVAKTKFYESFTKHIPIISGFIGAALGLTMFLVNPSSIAANDFLTAIIVGGASGFSATGIHQLVKQFKPADTK